MKTKLSLLVLSLAMCVNGIAGSLTLNPAHDTVISPDTNFVSPVSTGLTNFFSTGTSGTSQGGPFNYRSLLTFDPSSIPTNAIVTNVTLTLRCFAAGQIANWVNLRKALNQWSDSESTWTNRLTGVPWGIPGGSNTVDYSSVISQSNFVTGVSVVTFASSAGLIADVQDWIANPSNNNGWFLISGSQGTNNTVRRFSSVNDSVSTNWPTLVVQWADPPPELVPCVITNVALVSSDQFSLSFWATSNLAYLVEYKSEVTDANWITLTNIPASPVSADVTVTDSISPERRYYRAQPLAP